MAPHPIPKIYPDPSPKVQETFKRRLEMPQAMTPPPRSRQIQVLSWALSIGVSAYVVLFADFGEEKNCYTPIREWFQDKRKQFWSLSDQEKKELKEQGKL